MAQFYPGVDSLPTPARYALRSHRPQKCEAVFRPAVRPGKSAQEKCDPVCLGLIRPQTFASRSDAAFVCVVARLLAMPGAIVEVSPVCGEAKRANSVRTVRRSRSVRRTISRTARPAPNFIRKFPRARCMGILTAGIRPPVTTCEGGMRGLPRGRDTQVKRCAKEQ